MRKQRKVNNGRYPRFYDPAVRDHKSSNGSWPNQAGVVRPNQGIKDHELRLKKWQFIWFKQPLPCTEI